ncbi:MAG: hypothetical protein KDA28_05465, partial [Phycisphaerales bacterium]|nr:hypothetical protein [Phycisphaerales bacterium]
VETTDRLHLMIDVETPPRHAVEWSTPDLGEFTLVSDSGAAPPDLDDGRLHRRRLLVLEPFLDGTANIPAQTITITDLDGGERQTITTDPIEVTVRSVLDDPEALDVAPARPLAPLETRVSRTPLVVAVVIVGVLGVGLVVFWWTRPDPDRARRTALRTLARDLDEAADPARTVEVYRSIVATLYGPEALAATATDVRLERVLHEMPFASRSAFAAALEWRERTLFAREGVDLPDSIRQDARQLLEGAS